MFATAVRFLAQRQKVKKKDRPPNFRIGQEGQQWSGRLTEIVKEHGPLGIGSFWDHAQTTGLRSKRHMKVILKWMKEQNQIKLVCHHTGDRRCPISKEFLYEYFDPSSEQIGAEEVSENAESSRFPTDDQTCH